MPKPRKSKSDKKTDELNRKSKTERWCFTLFFKESKEEVASIYRDKLLNFDPPVKYAIYQMEMCPTTQRLHLQGYIVFPKQVTLANLKNNFSDIANFRFADGTSRHNTVYCSKPETRIGNYLTVIGEEPEEEEEQKKPGKRSDLQAFVHYIIHEAPREINEYELMIKYPNIFAKYPKFVERIIKNAKKRLISQEEKRNEPTQLHIILGSTNTGKTTYLKKLPDVYFKNPTKWWNDYSGQENVVFNDYNLDSYYQPTSFLVLADHAPFQIEIKGTVTQLLAKNIWISTNLSKLDILSQIKACHQDAFERRTKWYTMNTTTEPYSLKPL